TDHPLPRRVLPADTPASVVNSQPRLPGARSAFPLSRGPFHAHDSRRGRGWAQRGPRPAARGLPLDADLLPRSGAGPWLPWLLAHGPEILEDWRGRAVPLPEQARLLQGAARAGARAAAGRPATRRRRRPRPGSGAERRPGR